MFNKSFEDVENAITSYTNCSDCSYKFDISTGKPFVAWLLIFRAESAIAI